MRPQRDLQNQSQRARPALAVESARRLYEIYNTDAFEWLKDASMNSIEAKPPYPTSSVLQLGEFFI